MSIEYYIKYNFQNKQLLEEALSHPSLNNQKHTKQNKCIRDYERFELLGDAILSFVITDILIKIFPYSDEGMLSKIKSVLISKEILFEIALKINLDKYILLSPGEESSGGRQKIKNLSNSMEAVLAAIYLDSQNIEQVYQIIKTLWSPKIKTLNLIQKDPKTFLQEWAHAKKYPPPQYIITNKKGKMHFPTFEVELRISSLKQKAQGNSIKAAEKTAAQAFIASFIKEKGSISK